jgi:hypothetical protein
MARLWRILVAALTGLLIGGAGWAATLRPVCRTACAARVTDACAGKGYGQPDAATPALARLPKDDPEVACATAADRSDRRDLVGRIETALANRRVLATTRRGATTSTNDMTLCGSHEVQLHATTSSPAGDNDQQLDGTWAMELLAEATPVLPSVSGSRRRVASRSRSTRTARRSSSASAHDRGRRRRVRHRRLIGQRATPSTTLASASTGSAACAARHRARSAAVAHASHARLAQSAAGGGVQRRWSARGAVSGADGGGTQDAFPSPAQATIASRRPPASVPPALAAARRHRPAPADATGASTVPAADAASRALHAARSAVGAARRTPDPRADARATGLVAPAVDRAPLAARGTDRGRQAARASAREACGGLARGAAERRRRRLRDRALASADRRARPPVLRDAARRRRAHRHPVERAVGSDEELHGAARIGRELPRIAVEAVSATRSRRARHTTSSP